MKDSYNNLEKYINNKGLSLYDWAINEIESFYIDNNSKYVIKEKWKTLKESINNKKPLYIRGRCKHADEYIKIYAKLDWNVKTDNKVNYLPKKSLGEITTYWVNNQDFKYKERYITGYTVSHIWGYTHNPLLFNCPWNICYTPISIDPLTGHMTKSEMKSEFKKRFLKSEYYKKIVKPYVKEYNTLLKEIYPKIEKAISINHTLTKVQKNNFLKEWSEINPKNIFEGENII